jgi:hypothetical protein
MALVCGMDLGWRGWSAAQLERQPGQIAGQIVIAGVAHGGGVPGAAIALIDGRDQVVASAMSDGQGRFVVDDLEPGRYVVTASKAGFVGASYGAPEFGYLGVPVALDSGQRVNGLTLRLPIGASISGRVLDESGRLLPGVSVRLRIRGARGRVPALVSPVTAVAAGAVTTLVSDDRGAFRFYGLPAGQYAVVAERRPTPEGTSFRPTYYPSSTDPDRAAMIELGPGQQLDGVDVMVRRERFFQVDGHLISSTGRARELRAALTPDGPFINPVTARADGSFTFSNVPAGQYRLMAWSTAPSLWGETPVDVSGQDMLGVSVSLDPAGTLTGRIALVGTGSNSVDLARLRVTIPVGSLSVYRPQSAVDLSGHFSIGGVPPGVHGIVITEPGDKRVLRDWHLAAIDVGGQDGLVDPPTFGSGMSVRATVVMTSSQQLITGVLTHSGGGTTADYMVVVFPFDPRLRLKEIGRTRLSRPDAAGRYVVEGLPPGRYQICVVRLLPVSAFDTPEIYESLASSSILVDLAPGQRVQRDISLR